jgi:carbonic anhydrase
MGKFDRYAFSAAPSFDEAATREAFAKAVPLRTLVIHCYDPRASEIPNVIAKVLGGEVYPGPVIHDEDGHKVASTATIFPIVVAGGRAVDALRSISVAQHLFGIETIAVVHHSHCGATTFTAEGIIDAFRHEHHAEIAGLYPPESICIADYERAHDVALIRASAGTPPHADIIGFFYDIDTGALTETIRSAGAKATTRRAGLHKE